SNQQVIVDITTARSDVQQYGIDATYTLVEKATGKSVMTGQTFARVSYDNPGQAQRFSNARGQRDAENRAAKQISGNIRSRLLHGRTQEPRCRSLRGAPEHGAADRAAVRTRRRPGA